MKKSALITGANKGIGLEVAKQLLKNGFYVYLGCRNLEKGLHAVEDMKAEGLADVEAVRLDVTHPESVQNARSDIGKKTGVLDVLINNAGISGMPQHPLETTTDNFKQVYETNVYGVVRTTQEFIDLLKESEEPRIVNVSSNMGSLTLQSDPGYAAYHYKTLGAYASSKSAMNMYTVHLAYELRDTNFKINAVCPGYTKTDFTNHLGTGTVEEAAQRIVRYAMIDQSGPTGKFFSEDANPLSAEIPW
jgi:NAD(P)-dependent dehydrogenase (short-subunit alcohol dehydrogenase family)